MLNSSRKALESVVTEYSGRPVEKIRPVLKQRWYSSNHGANMSDPELTTIADLISRGKRVMEPDGTIMGED